jgi:Flp pilus assembly protein TadG
MVLRTNRQRRGANAVEFAIIAPLLFLLIFAHIIGGMAVFDYIQTVNLAREGARYASVHGNEWQIDVVNGNAPYTANPSQAATTPTDVYNNAIAPKIIGLDTTNVNTGGRLTYSVTWADSGQQPTYYDATSGTFKTNTVTCQVSYAYNPIIQMMLPVGTTLTSSSTMNMQY